jgi:hypothetical protein
LELDAYDGGKSSIAEQWKTYRDKKKEFRDNNKGKKAGNLIRTFLGSLDSKTIK